MKSKKDTLCVLVRKDHSEFVKPETLVPKLSVKTSKGTIIECALHELLPLVEDCGEKSIPTILCEQKTEIIKNLAVMIYDLQNRVIKLE